MKSCNLSLRKAIYAKLNEAINVPTQIPIFYNYAPNETNGNYIIFSIISQREIGTACTNSYTCNVQFKIYTSEIGSNTGVITDRIAERLYELIYPNKQELFVLDTPFNHFGTNLISDNISNKIDVGNQIYIDRIINFEFKISST